MTNERVSIGVLIGSNRPLRAGRDLAQAVAALVEETGKAHATLLDLREIQLPWYDEPKPPAAGDYQHEHTRKWAQTISSFDAIIIVTAQYNGGYPAPLKNAIDTVYREWKDKPLFLVSYGGPRSRGGSSAVRQLQVVFSVVPVNLLERTVSMPLTQDDYQQPGAVLKDAPAVIERHRADLEAGIAELIAAAQS